MADNDESKNTWIYQVTIALLLFFILYMLMSNSERNSFGGIKSFFPIFEFNSIGDVPPLDF
jgi:uncharacterized membrane protein